MKSNSLMDRYILTGYVTNATGISNNGSNEFSWQFAINRMLLYSQQTHSIVHATKTAIICISWRDQRKQEVTKKGVTFTIEKHYFIKWVFITSDIFDI